MTALPRFPYAIAATILLVAVALSCNSIDVTRPRVTLKQLTVGVPAMDTVARGSARVYALGVSPGVLYRVSITGLTDDVDLYVFGSDSTFGSTVTCLIDRTILFNTTPEDCTLVAASGILYLGVGHRDRERVTGGRRRRDRRRQPICRRRFAGGVVHGEHHWAVG